MMNLVVALPAEARPLIEFYRLDTKTTLGAFRIYRRAAMSLIISGPGKVAAAAATALLGAGHEAGTRAAWLNIGIAGHATRATGDCLLAHRITDHANGRSWYPPQLLDLSMATASLITVDVPENDYRQDAAYDMEASGYFPVASRFSSAELVQCLKLVSDNREQPAAAITAQHCTRLVAEKLDAIDQVIAALTALAQEYNGWHAAPAGLERLTSHWHFSVSQQHQLAELARRWQVLEPEQPFWLAGLERNRQAAEVLKTLQRYLDSRTPVLAPRRHRV